MHTLILSAHFSLLRLTSLYVQYVAVTPYLTYNLSSIVNYLCGVIIAWLQATVDLYCLLDHLFCTFSPPSFFALTK